MIFIITYVLTIMYGFIVIPLLKKKKVNQVEREFGPQSHMSKEGTPTMGGIIMAFAILTVSIIIILFFKQDYPHYAKDSFLIILSTFGFMIVGFADDFKKVFFHMEDGISPKTKMIRIINGFNYLCIAIS